MSREGERVVLKVFLFTDLVGSTELKQRLGDIAGARAIRSHNDIFREALRRYDGVEEDNAGDGFFATFDVPSKAVDCALDFQQSMAGSEGDARLHTRIGVHMGQAAVMRGQVDDELFGLSIDTAARVMGLALGDQVLLTQAAFDSVRQFITDAPDGSDLEWLAHGNYRIKGVDGPISIFEVGIPGLSPLCPPPDSQKARRDVAPEDADTLGWRPAIGKEIPRRSDWRLTRKLGEGAFGEAWLAEHTRSRTRHVFKFCFLPDRLRALKREVTLLRVLKTKLGDRPDIACLLDWQLDDPPFYLESEYAQEGDLPTWAEGQMHASPGCSGLSDVPLETRLELVAQTADALSNAHRVGVLHNDIKPSNILITNDARGRPSVRLADFGIGLIADRESVGDEITGLSIATEIFADSASSAGGTHLYMAPERLSGLQSSVQSDIYSLGVVLYQMVLGDLGRPLSFGWEREIDDDLLRDDIAVCVDGSAAQRLSNASEMAERLRGLDQRRSQRQVLKRSKELRFAAILAAIGLTLGLGVFTASTWVRDVAVSDVRGVVEEQVLGANEMVAHVAAGLLEGELTDARNRVLRIAANPSLARALRVGDRAAIQGLLDSARDQSPALFSLGVADVNGNLVRRSPRDPGLEGRNFRFRDWFNAGDESQRPLSGLHFSEPFVSQARGNEALVAISTPIRDEAGALAGVLLGTMSLAAIQELVEGAPRAEGSAGLVVVVMNDREQLVVHPQNPLFAEGQPALWRPVFDTTRGGARVATDPLIGEDQRFLVGSKRFYPGSDAKEKGWQVAVLRGEGDTVLSVDEIGTDIDRFQIGVGLFGIALILAAVAAIHSIRSRDAR
ncbi:MAG: protein kinase [Deltaproteobacteria bacterium]|nr:protein kinase [Deltaproteobacteria bacterium]